MTLRRRWWVGICFFYLGFSVAAGAEFDRIEGDTLASVVRREDAKRRGSLTFAEIEGLPAVLPDSHSAFLVVKTGQGNYTRLLVSSGLRKSPVEGADPVPVLILDRFDTFEPGRSGSRSARGSGVIVFEGFQVDLDTGQIVPPGQGGDLEFRKAAGQPLSLRPLGGSAMFTLTRPVAAGPTPAGPSSGKAVQPSDFAGRFRLVADGRWTGLLELQVAPDRQVSGRFRSETNGTSYPVAGHLAPENPQKVQFTVKFPRTEQEYDGFLWTEGKNVIAGSFVMGDRTFGFVAVREGTRLAPLE